jgi:hypothetical protein
MSNTGDFLPPSPLFLPTPAFRLVCSHHEHGTLLFTSLVFRACRLRMEGHTGLILPRVSQHCPRHRFPDYVRAVAYAGGRLFSAGDDKTVRLSRSTNMFACILSSLFLRSGCGKLSITTAFAC